MSEKKMDKCCSHWKTGLADFLKEKGGRFFLFCRFHSSNRPNDLPKCHPECFTFSSSYAEKQTFSKEEGPKSDKHLISPYSITT